MWMDRLRLVLFLLITFLVGAWLWSAGVDYPGRWEVWWLDLERCLLPILFFTLLLLPFVLVLGVIVLSFIPTAPPEPTTQSRPRGFNPHWLFLLLPVLVAGAAHIGRDPVKEGFLLHREHFEEAIARIRSATEP